MKPSQSVPASYFDKIYQKITKPSQSLPASYFDKIYQNSIDPWQYTTSEYEAEKYATTIAALPNAHYRSALEIGGSIGVLTEKLAPYCDSLLSIEVSQLAQNEAIKRCQELSQVRFDIMSFPQQFPDEVFDLILISEVAYFWSREDLKIAQQRILELLEIGGHLLLVHWLPRSPDFPLTGDEVHDSFLNFMPQQLQHLNGKRNAKYRLDLFQRR